MHALAAHGYHWLLRLARIATWPVWQSLLAALAVAAAVRLVRSRRVAAVGTALAVLAGWMVMAPPAVWPLSPVARLPGLAALMLGLAAMPSRAQASWPATLAVAALAAWWLRGAPADLPGVAWCLPVFFVLLAGLAAANALARNGTGWTALAATLALAASLKLTGASPHWPVAALVIAIVAAALLGAAGPIAVLLRLTVCCGAPAPVCHPPPPPVAGGPPRG